MREVIKRDGSIQPFDLRKIKRALLMAFSAANVTTNVDILVNEISGAIRGRMSVEAISDLIEGRLYDYGFVAVAHEFIMYREARARIRSERLSPTGTGLTDYIHATKYARYLQSASSGFVTGRRETRAETIDRYIGMLIDRYPKHEASLRDAAVMMNKGWLAPSMRGLQFGGAAVLAHNTRLYNCSFTHIDRPRVFSEAFYALLCGCGVGYSVQWKHVDQLPRIVSPSETIEHWIIEDDIVGWATALDMLIRSYTVGGPTIEFSYHKIRPAGSPLVTSGGRAPGHLGLKRMLETVRRCFATACGRRMRPIECHDIMCHIAEAVLSGGIRRSSLLCLFSPDDMEMMYAKTAGNFDPSGLNCHRMMANNSVVILRSSSEGRRVFDRQMDLAVSGYGEPGFFFTDDLDEGCNPCGEIRLYPKTLDGRSGFAFCNLTEINVPASGLCPEVVRAATLLGTLQAGFNDFGYLGSATRQIQIEQPLIGVSLTGIMDDLTCIDKLAAAASLVLRTNEDIAHSIGILPSPRCTTVKPSGTCSLWMGGIGSGVNEHHAKRYFRRIVANPLETVAQAFRSCNPHAVEVMPNGDWSLIFPIQTPDSAICIDDLTATRKLEIVMDVYNFWVRNGVRISDHTVAARQYDHGTHNVSTTITVRDDEMKELCERIWKERENIAAISFAPYTLDTLYPFAPRKAVKTAFDEAKWNELIRKWKEVDYLHLKETHDSTSARDIIACGGGKCEL